MPNRGDNSDSSAGGGTGRAGVFVTTRWSLVGQLAGSDPARAAAALEQLCRAYWFPVYAFLRRQRGASPHDAEDLAQGFFEHLLEHETLRRAAREKGRFRSYLLGALGHYLANERDRQERRKRGGGRPIIPLEVALAEERLGCLATVPPTPEHFFDRHWAADLARHALARLHCEYNEQGKGGLLDILEPALTRPDTGGLYAECAARLSMREDAARVALHRLRGRFRDLLLEEVAQTVPHPEDAEAELRHIVAALTQ